MAAPNFELACKKAISFALKSFPNVKILKEIQEEAIISFVKRRDVMAILPTGYGKSLIFQLIPGICKYLRDNSFNYPSKPILLIICPLKALIESHLKELETCGITACSLSDASINEKEIKAGKFSFVFTSPEMLLENSTWRAMLQSSIYQENVFGLVTDEAHVVPKCDLGLFSFSDQSLINDKRQHIEQRGKGNAKEKKAAFRQCFFRLSEVRSILPLGAPVLALTATATSKVKKDTVQGIGMKPNCLFITVSPNRPNIYLYKSKVDQNLDICFEWFMDKIKTEKHQMPRTIVYCKSQKDCGKLFRHFKFNLQEHAYYPKGAEQNSKNMLIGMYHANTLSKHKERVSNSLFDANGICRVVFASTALGMGVNLRDVRQVIHYGPPRQADDFLQEIGRAGRDGLPAKSILFYTGHHLVKCEKTMKDYARSTNKCLRSLVLSEFDEPSTSSNEGTHKCCIICHRLCKCKGETCGMELPEFEKLPADFSEMPDRRKRNVSKTQKSELLELLLDYKDDLEKNCPVYVFSSESTTCFTDSLIKSVVKKSKLIFSIEDVIELTPVFKKSHAFNILHMVRDVFEDIEIDPDVSYLDEAVDLNFDFEYEGEYMSCSSESDNDSDSSVESQASEMSVLSGITEIQGS